MTKEKRFWCRKIWCIDFPGIFLVRNPVSCVNESHYRSKKGAAKSISHRFGTKFPLRQWFFTSLTAKLSLSLVS